MEELTRILREKTDHISNNYESGEQLNLEDVVELKVALDEYLKEVRTLIGGT